MSRPLDLPDPIYDALTDAAAASGTTPVGWIAARLPSHDQDAEALKGKTLADLFAGRTGRIESGGAVPFSDQIDDIFGGDLEQKRCEDRL